jgi:hypothetical protein
MSRAEHPLRVMRGSGPEIEVAPEPRLALAVRVLFTGGFDTLEIAALLQRPEAEIVDQLDAGRLAEGGR